MCLVQMQCVSLSGRYNGHWTLRDLFLGNDSHPESAKRRATGAPFTSYLPSLGKVEMQGSAMANQSLHRSSPSRSPDGTTQRDLVALGCQSGIALRKVDETEARTVGNKAGTGRDDGVFAHQRSRFSHCHRVLALDS
jgi:hypothetical protein